MKSLTRGKSVVLNLVLALGLLAASAKMIFAADLDDGPREKNESHSTSQPIHTDKDDDDDQSSVVTKSAHSDQDEDDLSCGMSESINIEEAWVENTLFLFASADNDFSKGRSFNLEGEWEKAFDHRFGIELEFPQILALQPLGNSPAALGPIGLNLRYVYYQFGTDKSFTAGVFSVQAGGAYWATPDSRFPGVGSGLTAEALAAFRHGRIFFQGLYGYSDNLNQNAFSGWMANTSLGVLMGHQWVTQVEADYSSNATLDADDGISGNQWIFTPQIGLKTGDWFFELGEKMNASPAGTAVLLIEREL